MKKKIIYLFLLTSLFLVSKSSAQTSNPFNEGIQLGFNDALHHLQGCGEFQSTWTLVKADIGWNVVSSGSPSFQWYGGGYHSFSTWYGIYQEGLLSAMQASTDEAYIARCHGQQLGVQLAHAQAMSGGSLIPPSGGPM